jgi:hypothetical protein
MALNRRQKGKRGKNKKRQKGRMKEVCEKRNNYNEIRYTYRKKEIYENINKKE